MNMELLLISLLLNYIITGNYNLSKSNLRSFVVGLIGPLMKC